MRDLTDPPLFWAEFDARTREISVALQQQLGLPSAKRWGLSALIDDFEDQRRKIGQELADIGRAKPPRKTAKNQLGTGEKARFERKLRERALTMKKLAQCLDQIRRGKARPLYPLPWHRYDLRKAHGMALDMAMDALHRAINPIEQTAEAEALGCFPDIPMRSDDFMAHVHAARRVALAQCRNRPLRFLDVGCGGGLTVLMASRLFEVAEGFDYDKAYVRAGQAAIERMGARRCGLHFGNALTYEGYAEYDVIYFYRPMSDPELLQKMEARIASLSRPGTVLIAPYLEFGRQSDALGCGRVEDAVFVSQTGQEAADALRREAEKIGPEFRALDYVSDILGVDWAKELALACARNGYVVQ